MKNYSLWLDGIDNQNYPGLDKNIEVDVLIIGGGITGISTLYHLIDSKLNVCLVERNKIGEGITLRTTGKITYMQGNIYSKLTKIYNYDVAKKYYESQKDAIKLIKDIVTKNNIACNFTKQKSFIYASNKIEIEKLKKEQSLLESFGEKVIVSKIPLDIPNYYTIAVSNTYYFHPLKYLHALANICFLKGQKIYENTNIIRIDESNDYYLCHTKDFVIKAKYVVLATHYPYFLFPYLFPLKGTIEKSYICSSTINTPKDISGISTLSNKSFRYYQNNLLYLDNTHNLAFKYNNKDNYKNLFNQNIKLSNNINHYWSNTDIITNDYLPYIGKLENNLYISTGYNTWGMTNGSLAGLIISDNILNKKNKYTSLFNPKRIKPLISYFNIFKDIFYNAYPFVYNKIIKNKSYYNKNVIFKKINGKNVAIYIDDFKKEHIVYSTCPHLKCSLIFNETEHTWDCPCHASRFTLDGKCIVGPSNKDITYKE